MELTIPAPHTAYHKTGSGRAPHEITSPVAACRYYASGCTCSYRRVNHPVLHSLGGKGADDHYALGCPNHFMGGMGRGSLYPRLAEVHTLVV